MLKYEWVDNLLLEVPDLLEVLDNVELLELLELLEADDTSNVVEDLPKPEDES